MALLTDSDLITLDDLIQFENAIQQVSVSHNIDVQAKIKISRDGIGDKLSLWMVQAGIAPSQPLGAVSAPSSSVFSFTLANVIATPAIYRWLCFDSLARIYSEAYNVQLNTRFQGKMTEYQKQAQEVGNLVYVAGLELVSRPLPRPAAPSFVIGQGSLAMPAVFAQVSWVDDRGQESAPSAIGATVLNGFASFGVQMAAATTVPKTAVGWNLYAGGSQNALYKQNLSPIDTSAQWNVPAGGLEVGTANPTQGQVADLRVALCGRLQRG